MKPQAQTDTGEPLLQRLSALCDGEARGSDVDAALSAWRSNAPQVRQRWHAYSVIGDVLRSEDLSPRSASHDAAFVERLRARLAQEPVVLAPQAEPPPAAATAGWTWRRLSAPMAMAAGVMTVVGVAVMMRPGTPEALTGDAQVATAGGNVVPVRVEVYPAPRTDLPGGAAASSTGSADVLLRDPQLDRYLEEHRLRSRGAAVAVSAEDGLRQVGVPAR
jgi:sigma-E factor negative regulatory protein RseA